MKSKWVHTPIQDLGGGLFGYELKNGLEEDTVKCWSRGERSEVLAKAKKEAEALNKRDAE